MSPPVTVVVPVYRGADDVRACLASIARHPAAPGLDVEVVAIDDASPEPEVRAVLDEAARRGLTVVRNPRNLGFVATANRGFALAGRRDVVLLNADTVVTEGWLDRLADAASGPDVATVTPLTGHGSICTLPAAVIAAFALDGPDPRVDDCAAHIARHSLHRRPEVISGVGFCMWVTRAALDLVGLFDEEAFGRGYGEEVDWCIRASRAGLRHLVEDSTFVHHRGGVSFGDERVPAQARASRLIHDRYRFFGRANRRERGDDPLAATWAALRLGLAERDPDRIHVLHLLHTAPDATGGTEAHVRRLVADLSAGVDATIMHPTDSGFVLRCDWVTAAGPVRHELLLPGAAHRPGRLEDAGAALAVRTALDLLDVDVAHVHELLNLSLSPLAALAEAGVPTVVTVHDQSLACLNHSVLFHGEVACGLPDDRSACASCLPATTGRPIEDLDRHRALVAAAVPQVARWVAPSRSAADHLGRVHDLPADRVEVIPHGALVPPLADRALDPVLVHEEPLRLGFVGRGWAKKGLRTINRLCAALADTTIEVHHLGALIDDAHPDLHLHGPYDSGDLPLLLRAAGIGIVVLPGHVPETFSYVVSEALAAGVPVIGARHGALGERIRATGAGWTFDPERPEDLVDLVRAIDRCRDALAEATARAAAERLETAADVSVRYDTMYRDLVGRLPT